MKWRVQTTASGAYKIIPKTGEANDYVLATSTSLGTNNADLVQGDYILNNSYRDEWNFCPDTAVLLAKKEVGDHNKNAYFPDTVSWLQTSRNGFITAVKTHDFESIEESLVINYLQTHNIFMECSHGNKTMFRINGNPNDPPFDGDGICAGQLGSYDLSDIDLLVLMSCESGKNYYEGAPASVCLVNGGISGGAKCVIGFSNKMERSDAWYFLSYLLHKCIGDGYTIQQAFDVFSIDSYTYMDCYQHTYIDPQFRDCVVLAGDTSFDFRH